MTAGEAPQLAAVLADEQVEPVEVGELGVALGRLGIADARIVQHGSPRAGIAEQKEIPCQQLYQRCQRVPTDARERAHFVVDLSL